MQPHELKLPHGHLPPGAIGHNRGVVRPNYAFFAPEGVLNSRLPHYDGTVARFLAAPVLGAEFAQFVLHIEAGGGTNRTVREEGVQHFYYVLSGTADLRIADAAANTLDKGGFAYIPPGTPFTLRNAGSAPLRVLGLRKRYETIDLPQPEPIVSSERDVPVTNHTGAHGRGFQHLLPFGDMRFDFEMNLMRFAPGTSFPAVETHIMEHGLYMLEGQGLYLLGDDWHEIWADDFIWMGPFCPQQFYPTGFGEAVYLLYKNMNRDVPL
jgi:(S)-ureidoglycine aminohydrolase